MVRTAALLGREPPAGAPQWVVARMLQERQGRALLLADHSPQLPLSAEPRWVPFASAAGEPLLRPVDRSQGELGRLGPAAAPAVPEPPPLEVEAGCPVDVSDPAAPSGWRTGEVVSRTSRTGLYTVQLGPDAPAGSRVKVVRADGASLTVAAV